MESTRKLSRQAVEMHVDHEMSMESFDERRVAQLKSQIIQLERQVVLMTNIISGSKQNLLFAESLLHQHSEFLRKAAHESESSRVITLNKKDVERQIKETEKITSQLSTDQDHNHLEAEIFTAKQKFLKKERTLKLGDLCSYKSLNHINLAQVAYLENRLAGLYGKMCQFQMLLKCEKTRLKSDCEDLLLSVEQTCDDLLTLSLLVPSVHGSQRKALPEVTADSVMATLPKLSKAKHNEARALIDLVLKLSEHRQNLLKEKINRLELELSFLHSKATNHDKFIEKVITALSLEHNKFHQNLVDTLVTPLSGLLQKFSKLAQDPSDTSLREFLSDFKTLAPQMSEVCEKVSSVTLDDKDENFKELQTSYEKNLRSSVKMLETSLENSQTQENQLRQLELEIQNNLKLSLSECQSNDTGVANNNI